MKIAVISAHAGPLAGLGGADVGSQDVHVAEFGVIAWSSNVWHLSVM